LIIFGSAFGSIFGTVAALRIYHRIVTRRMKLFRKKPLPQSLVNDSFASNPEDLENSEILDQHHQQELEDLEKLIREQLTRNYQFFGEDGQNLIRKSFVVIAGQGSIGSHVACSLVRSGVQKIRIIDKGTVKLVDLASNGFAYLEDVGFSKVSVSHYYIKQICGHVSVEEFDKRIKKNNLETL
jgi:FlaA1/EpsC-like NDP-sugar epimerase